jgi:Na+/proline symporter
MLLAPVDWIIITVYLVLSLIIGLYVSRQAGKNITEFFAAGKSMPWWLLGVSMVATTFSADTPNLVTNIVRSNGVAGNWTWWAFLLTGMLTVFVYAHLWKRSGVLTDIEFYELRYSGKSASFLRGFRAIYLGLFFNVMVMASVSLAAIKLGSVLLGLSPIETIGIAATVTVIYSSLGGLRGVLLTDFFQFILAMIGSVAEAIFALHQPEVGGLHGLFSHASVLKKIDILPYFSDPTQAIAIFIVPLSVQWWSTYYPSSVPGGGGYIAQRMFAAKDENNSMASVFFYNVMQYALRSWPWIIVALCSIIVFPSVASMKTAFPQAASVAANDMGYPAMLSFIPAGWLGLVVASLIAAYMSTMSTQVNWGSSYLINDVYIRFIRPESSPEEQVMAGRISTVVLMAIASVVALLLKSALQSFHILLEIGVGTGLPLILRWFWWRLNAITEITAMAIAFVVVIYFEVVHPLLGLPPVSTWEQFIIGVVLATVGWLIATFLTRPTDHETLVEFCKLARPGGPGWKKVRERAKKEGQILPDEGQDTWSVPQGIICMLLGCVAIYGILFATGYWIYGNYVLGGILTAVAFISSILLYAAWKKLRAIRERHVDLEASHADDIYSPKEPLD